MPYLLDAEVERQRVEAIDVLVEVRHQDEPVFGVQVQLVCGDFLCRWEAQK